MRSVETPGGTPESRQVYGGDELYFWANQTGVENAFMGVFGSEDINRFSNAAR
jgi:hypothetical protein